MNNTASTSEQAYPVLQATGLHKSYVQGKSEVHVLQHIDLTVHAGQTIAIVGASGSGKSTLLHLLGGLDTPTQGTVAIKGRNLTQFSPTTLGNWRNQHVGFVYQFHHLLPELSAMENVAMPLWIRRTTRAKAAALAGALLEKVGLGDRMQHKPSALSGGERQRVAIARALITQPACILADEPTGNLDKDTAKTVFGLMLDLTQTAGTALILVTHDEALAAQCQQQYRLQQGTLVAC